MSSVTFCNFIHTGAQRQLDDRTLMVCCSFIHSHSFSLSFSLYHICTSIHSLSFTHSHSHHVFFFSSFVYLHSFKHCACKNWENIYIKTSCSDNRIVIVLIVVVVIVVVDILVEVKVWMINIVKRGSFT